MSSKITPRTKPAHKVGDLVMISQGSCWCMGTVVRVEPLHYQPWHEELARGAYEWKFTVRLADSGGHWGAAHKLHIREPNTNDILLNMLGVTHYWESG